jgi:hypothetical protein
MTGDLCLRPLTNHDVPALPAAAIPGAQPEFIEGTGHDLPLGARPLILDAITLNARRGPASRPGWSQ